MHAPTNTPIPQIDTYIHTYTHYSILYYILLQLDLGSYAIRNEEGGCEVAGRKGERGCLPWRAGTLVLISIL